MASLPPSGYGIDMLERVLRDSFDAIVITTLELESPGPIIVYVNGAFEELTGYRAHEVLGVSPRILQGPRTDRGVLDSLRQCLLERRTFHGVAVNYRKSGAPFWLEWRVAGICDREERLLNWISFQREVRSPDQNARHP